MFFLFSQQQSYLFSASTRKMLLRIQVTSNAMACIKFLKHCLHKEILFLSWGKAFGWVLIYHQHNSNYFIKQKWHGVETHLCWCQQPCFIWGSLLPGYMLTGFPASVLNLKLQGWMLPIFQGNEDNCSKMPLSYLSLKCQSETSF